MEGEIVFEGEFGKGDGVGGMEGFDYVWVIWEFCGNREKGESGVVGGGVLGGNEKVGVFGSGSGLGEKNIGV